MNSKLKLTHRHAQQHTPSVPPNRVDDALVFHGTQIPATSQLSADWMKVCYLLDKTHVFLVPWHHATLKKTERDPKQFEDDEV